MAAVCPYCRMPFDEASPPQIFCTACGMPHHEDCYHEMEAARSWVASAPPQTIQNCRYHRVICAVPMPALCAFCAAVCSHARRTSLLTARTSGYHLRYSGPLGLSQAAAPAPAQIAAAAPNPLRSRRLTLIPLRLMAQPQKPVDLHCAWYFSGLLGIHNFYAGYIGRGVGQLCLSVFTLGYLGVMSWIWAIIEICIVEKDSTGQNFS